MVLREVAAIIVEAREVAALFLLPAAMQPALGDSGHIILPVIRLAVPEPTAIATAALVEPPPPLPLPVVVVAQIVRRPNIARMGDNQ